MAGIGFELKRIYGRKTLASNIWGTVYATMTTIGPAVISAILMLILQLLMNEAGLTIRESRFYVSATTYVFVIATLTSVVFAAPVSRYISDCIFLTKEEDICPSAFGVLGLTTIISGIVMFIMCAAMYLQDNVPVYFLVIYYFFGVLVNDAYTMMTYASALKQYKALTLSFFVGLLLSIGVYFHCVINLNINKVTAACLSLACCYFIVVFALVFQVVKAFGKPKGKYFAFLSYVKKYPKLTIGSFAYSLGIYAPTLIYWIFAVIGEKISIFRTVPVYDLSLFMAVVVNTPSLVIFVVKVETSFYEKYTQYVSALNSGTYSLIQKWRDIMTRELRQQLFFVFGIQLVITIVFDCLVVAFFPYLSVNDDTVQMFVLLSLGIYTVFCMYFTIVVFYYFSDYTSACISSVVFLAVTMVCSFISVFLKSYYPLPLLIGGIFGWIVSFLLLRNRMDHLDSFLMC